MALNIDLSRAAESSSARIALIQAIVDAPAYEPETDYVEWKVQMDLLTQKYERAEAATYVLGFANREVATAHLNMEGHGYLVIGAEPGHLVGMQPIDSAKLVAWLEPYVGGIGVGPQWDVHWVDVGGTHVLLISVSPPRDGDPLYPVRKEFTAVVDGKAINIANGAVYIRRNGQTVEANAAELDMLTARARGSGTRTDVVVQPPGGVRASIRPVDASDELLEPYLAARKARLMASLINFQRSQQSAGTDGPMSVASEFARGANAISAAVSKLYLDTEEPESRTPDEYEAQVDDYIEALRKKLPPFLAWMAMKKHPQTLDLEVRNLTDHNFQKLAVDVHIEGSVLAFNKVPAIPKMPQPPRQYGPTRRPGLYDGLLSGNVYAPVPSFATSFRDVDLTPRPRIRNGGSADVSYPALDIRPRAVEPLDPVDVIAGVRDAGTTVTARWKATSTSASGQKEGIFLIEVLSEALMPNDLLGVDGEDPWKLARAANEQGGGTDDDLEPDETDLDE